MDAAGQSHANGFSRPGARPDPVSLDVVRVALDRILASSTLRHTDRLRRFLRFVVERTLDGHGDGLKEYVLGVEVFDRPQSFDPRVDPVVRVEARRLRFKLRDYYEGEGRGDPVVIDLPKGSYVPAFRPRPPAVDPAAQPAAAPARTEGALPFSSVRRVFSRPMAMMGTAALLVLAAVGVYVTMTSGFWRTVDVPTVAVLPFESISADADNEHFCFGMVEELTTALAQVEGLRVVARTSASQFTRGMDVTQIGRRLQANLLVEGSVRKAGDRLRVTAQLVDAVGGAHLWARTFERQVRDAFATQDEIAKAITTALQLRVASPTGARASRRGPADPDAYTLYLKGQYFRHRPTRDDLGRAVDYFSQAVSRDPGYAAAHAGLAAAYAALAYGEVAPPEREIALARAEGQRALEFDAEHAETHATLAWLAFFYDWDWAVAARGFTRALELNPNLAEAHHRYAILLLAEGRFDDALEECRQALELDPLSARISANRALILLCARRYDEAIRQSRLALELVQQNNLAHGYIGSSYAMQGQYEKAYAAYANALVALPGDPDAAASLARAYALDGHRQKARDLITDLERPDRLLPASRYELAFAYAGLGDRDRVFALLDEARARHETELAFLAVDPLFDGVRSDPRYGAFLDTLGFRR